MSNAKGAASSQTMPPLRGGEPKASAALWSPLSPQQVISAVGADPLTKTMTSWLIFPGVIGIEGQQGGWGDAVGKQRVIKLADKSDVTETIIEVEPGRAFRYTLTNFTGVFGKLVYGVYGEWRAEAAKGGGTLLRWTWIFPALPGRHLPMKYFVAPLRSAYHRRAVRAVLDLAEREARG